MDFRGRENIDTCIKNIAFYQKAWSKKKGKTIPLKLHSEKNTHTLIHSYTCLIVIYTQIYP